MTVPFRCIVGPTAAGKSALALQLAEQRGLAIVSADSRQVYREFDIGTAKPSRDEQRRVPHYGLDVVPPTERYSAHRWAESAQRWLSEAQRLGTPPIIVGGTGLYVRALVEPLDPVPELDPARRAILGAWLNDRTGDELARWCDVLDPARASLGRTQRLRAIETALLTGQRLSVTFRDREATTHHAPVDVRYLVVDPGPVLADRIAHRVHAMLDAGFREEVDRLRACVPADAPAWRASGYTVLRASREGLVTEAEAIARVTIETRQYAKRQRTWFRHQLPGAHVTRLDPGHPDALQQALDWWDASGQEEAR